MGPSPLPVADSASGPLTLAAPYSLTQVLSITAADATGVSVNASFNVVPVPEPGIASLIGLALATLTLPYLREKRNGSKAVS
jgi:hypothetical protein